MLWLIGSINYILAFAKVTDCGSEVNFFEDCANGNCRLRVVSPDKCRLEGGTS